MKHGLPDLEHVLIFLRRLKDDPMTFGDFEFGTIFENKELKDNETLLIASDNRKKSNLSVIFSVSTETVITSISDHYTVLGETSVKFEKKRRNQSICSFTEI